MRFEMTTSAPADWDAFVDRHPDATAYQRAAAVAIARHSFGLRTYYLAARTANGVLCGVLPLVEQSSVAFGRYLVSVPYFTYGGILANDSAAVTVLVDGAIKLAGERKAAHVELRHSHALPYLEWSQRLDKVSMVLKLPDSEAALAKQLGAKLRSQIRRADREQPEIIWGHAELLDQFYPIFAATMHELGTPVYSRAFFATVLAAFADRAAVLVIRTGGTVQSAAIVVDHGSRIEVPWAAAGAAAKRGALNMCMYWEMLKFSIARGSPAFDFGRSTVGSGTFRFKAQWGAEPMQLHWHYWLLKGGELPKLNHSNPKYALAGAIWKRMPLWFANLLGPYLARNLP